MLMIAMALASNLALSFLPARHLLSWYVAAPVLVADTLWVSWALHSTGAIGQGFFLLCSFVLFLTMVGENVPMLLLGSGLVCGASFAFESPALLWTPSHLLRLLFLYAGPLFYGHVLGQLRRERVRADPASARRRRASSSSSTVCSTSASSSRARCPSRSSPYASPPSSATSSAVSGSPCPRASRCAGGATPRCPRSRPTSPSSASSSTTW